MDLFSAFEAPYMQRALIVVLALSVLGAAVGTHVHLRKQAFLVESLQHTILPGIAIAFVVDGSLLLGASLAALATVVLFAILNLRPGLDRDSVLALLVTVFMGLGLVIVSSRDGFQRDLTGLLFGRVLATTQQQVVETLVLAALVLVVLALLHKELVLAAFDRVAATSNGYRVAALDLVLNVAVAITVVAAVRTLGTILVLAFVITPVMAARLIARHIGGLMALAACFAVAGSVAGLYFSYRLSVDNGVDVPAGAFAVVCITGLLIVVQAAAALAGLGRRTSR